jgi:myo-inositol 2-dehydrogenase/D-chiro-inositol 1-dehydrogenase
MLPGDVPTVDRDRSRPVLEVRSANVSLAQSQGQLTRSTPDLESSPVNVGLIGAGVMGAFHGETLATRILGARLAGVADTVSALAEKVAARHGCLRWTDDASTLLADPEIHAVVIATPPRFHADAVVAAAEAGKAIFCEKPLTEDLAEADRALQAVRSAGVLLQVGFQRRFDRAFLQAHELVTAGKLGSIQLLRSITRDPRLERPESMRAWALFRETLVHDFDVLRWLSGGAEPVELFAMADALVRPELKEQGMRDTAVVAVRFDNGALGTADASFQAVYGYDVRAEVFGSAGMATVGDGRQSSLVHYTPEGALQRRVDWFTELFGEAYTRELAHFVECVRTGATPACTGEDGRAAVAMASAAVRSAETGRPVKLAEVG